MKRLIVIALVLAASTIAAYSQPKLEIVGGDTYDWGNTPPKVLFTELKLKNVGNKPLYISDVKPSCSCTTAPLDKNTIQPGDYATLKVNLSLNVSNSGQVKKFIKMITNDPKNKEKVITLRANVVLPFVVSPMSYLKFIDATIGLKSKAVYSIENHTSEKVTFSNFEMSDGLSINWKGKKVSVNPGGSIQLVVTFSPNRTGYQSLSVKFKTSYDQMQYVTISGGANVEGTNYYSY